MYSSIFGCHTIKPRPRIYQCTWCKATWATYKSATAWFNTSFVFANATGAAFVNVATSFAASFFNSTILFYLIHYFYVTTS
ncbi:Uncharacterised protein [Streptococcus pneumoniae]|nr:Uncharacterised protein [Streptococcus pneumoniae]